MQISDIIKIKLSNMGYLPNYPYYLISDNEMFEAFLKEDGFFNDFYPCPEGAESVVVDDNKTLADAYAEFRNDLSVKISDHIENGTELPDWVYSYMIMNPVTFQSDERDIEYIASLFGLTFANGVPEYTLQLSQLCYIESNAWIKGQPTKLGTRKPTLFGEGHVIKSLRLKESSMLLTT